MIIKLAHNNPTKIKPKQYLPKSKEPIFDKNVGILELNWKVPKDTICEKSPYVVVGTMSFEFVFVLVIYDINESQHLMYLIPSSVHETHVFSGSLSVQSAIRVKMSDLIQFDPAIERKPPLVINSMFAFQPTKRLDLVNMNLSNILNADHFARTVVLMYNPKESNEFDLIFIGSKPELTKRHVDKFESPNEIVHILGFNEQGFILSHCITNEPEYWCAQDVQRTNGIPFGGSFQFQLFETITNKGHLYLIWVALNDLKSKKVNNNWRPVKWKSVSGFISVQTNSVVLFINNQFVYQYWDQNIDGQHMFSTKTVDDLFIFRFGPILKFPIEKYIDCDGVLDPHRVKHHKYNIDSNTYLRAMSIYILFGLHFVVATVMISWLMCFSVNSKKSNYTKRVKQTFRKTSRSLSTTNTSMNVKNGINVSNNESSLSIVSTNDNTSPKNI